MITQFVSFLFMPFLTIWGRLYSTITSANGLLPDREKGCPLLLHEHFKHNNIAGGTSSCYSLILRYLAAPNSFPTNQDLTIHCIIDCLTLHTHFITTLFLLPTCRTGIVELVSPHHFSCLSPPLFPPLFPPPPLIVDCNIICVYK